MMTQGEQNDTSELPEGMPLDYGYPLLPFDEGDWCECCGRVQPVKDGKCAVCGNGYDECQQEDGNEWHERFFNSTADAFLGVDDEEEDIEDVAHQGLNARMERLYPYLIDSE